MNTIEGFITYEKLVSQLMAQNGIKWCGNVTYEFRTEKNGIRYKMVGKDKERRGEL